jgi:hypothetical protein
MLIQISEGWYLQAGFLRYFSLDFSTNQGKKISRNGKPFSVTLNNIFGKMITEPVLFIDPL